MKKSLLFFIILVRSLVAVAQEEEVMERGFMKERLFIGASLNVGFSQGWILGLNPEVGYSLNNFLDVGIGTNVNYVTQNFGQGVSYRFLALGGGPYLRGWIINQFFVTGQFEYNRISETLRGTAVPEKSIYTAPSLLVGAGWGSRQVGNTQFFTSIMVDLLRNPNSPYVDRQTNTLLPVFRTGFMFYLGAKR